MASFMSGPLYPLLTHFLVTHPSSPPGGQDGRAEQGHSEDGKSHNDTIQSLPLEDQSFERVAWPR